jgi:phosphatidylglycerol lysyltransferase
MACAGEAGWRSEIRSGPQSEWRELLWAFRNLVDRNNGRIAFYQVGAEHLPLYLDLGLGVYKLGEEAILPIDGFTLEGSARKELRGAKNKGEREGLSFEIVPPQSDPALLNELKNISDDWLKSREGHEKGFSVGSFNAAYLTAGSIAVARREGRIVAFTNLLGGADKHELSVDLMRHRSDGPPGTMDYLFVELLLWGAASGFRNFNFGMSPLSGLSSDRLAPLWSRIGNLIFIHSNRYYNFLGLRRYKDKFNPHWRPKYLAAPGGLAVPRILIDTAALVSGGVRELFTK